MTQTWVSSFHRAMSSSLQAGAPIITPNGGSATSPIAAAISSALTGAQIYYTLDGTTPTVFSTLYTGPLSVSASATLQALVTAPGYLPSPAAAAVFVIQAIAPSISPAAGTYTTPQTITLTDGTVGASIYYTKDGTTPTFPVTGTTQLYVGPFSVATSATVKAIAAAPGLSNSAVSSAAFVINASSSALRAPITFFTAINTPQYQNYMNAAWCASAGKYNIIEYANLPGFEAGMTGAINTYAKSMAACKASAASLGNPQCLTGFYSIPQELFTVPPGPTTDLRTGLKAVIDANNWWVFTGPGPFPSGGHAVDTGFGSSVTNQTNQTPISTSSWTTGLNYNQASATYEFNCFVSGNGAAVGQSNGGLANPQCGFIVHDNRFWGQRNSGQWLCTATVYPQAEFGSDTTVPPFLQAGYKQELDKWRALCPLAGDGTTMLQGGNCDWGAFASPVVTSSVLGLWDMPFLENVFGKTNPISQFFSPNATLGRMALEETLMSSNPRAICILNVEGCCPGVEFPANQANWTNAITGVTNGEANNAGGSTIRTGNFWQAMRSFASFAMLRLPNGWAIDPSTANFSLLNGSTAPTQIPWLDEFQKGALHLWNWLGPAIDGPLTGTNITVGGVSFYLRRFTFGNVWHNPIGNPPVAVPATSLPGGTYQALATAGFGDPAINNGARGTTLNLNGGDGRFTLP